MIAELIVALADARPAAEVAAAFRACGLITANDEDEFMADFAYLLFGKLTPEMMDRSKLPINQPASQPASQTDSQTDRQTDSQAARQQAALCPR